jgi:hypothetical protein
MEIIDLVVIEVAGKAESCQHLWAGSSPINDDLLGIIIR